jgi:hypothetical protein
MGHQERIELRWRPEMFDKAHLRAEGFPAFHAKLHHVFFRVAFAPATALPDKQAGKIDVGQRYS